MQAARMLGQCAGLTYDTLAVLHTPDNATEIGTRPLKRLANDHPLRTSGCRGVRG